MNRIGRMVTGVIRAILMTLFIGFLFVIAFLWAVFGLLMMIFGRKRVRVQFQARGWPPPDYGDFRPRPNEMRDVTPKKPLELE